MPNNSNKKIAKSPERHTFQASNTTSPAVLEWWEQIRIEDSVNEQNPEWQKDNLEYDLRTSKFVIEKCKNEVYAQNLYAALCNNDFQKLEVLPILKNKLWSCSWRHAGGIIADIRGIGDYIDWYCSGIRNDYSGGYVAEMVVTDEIRTDLKSLGWVVI